MKVLQQLSCAGVKGHSRMHTETFFILISVQVQQPCTAQAVLLLKKEQSQIVIVKEPAHIHTHTHTHTHTHWDLEQCWQNCCSATDKSSWNIRNECTELKYCVGEESKAITFFQNNFGKHCFLFVINRQDSYKLQSVIYLQIWQENVII